MAAPRGRNFGAMADEMDGRKMMEEEMNRFEQEILTGQDEDDDDDEDDYRPAPPIVPPGIPQALSVLGTPDPSLMNLRFPAPPVVPSPTTVSRMAVPTSAPANTTAGAHQPASGGPLGFIRLPPPPAPPGTAPTSAAVELPGSYQQQRSVEGQSLPVSGQSSTQPFPPGVQGETSQLQPRPAFVPHSVRGRAPAMPHQPPSYRMQQHPQPHHRPQMRPQRFMHPMPGSSGGGPMNYSMPHHQQPSMAPGPTMGPMVGPGYPMMHHGPMGMVRPQAKPTTYSAKPVKFDVKKQAQSSSETSKPESAASSSTAKLEYKAPSQGVGQTAAFTPSATSNIQVPMQMYGGAQQPASADYSSLSQQQQQQQHHTEAAAGTSSTEQKKKDKKKKFIRTAASTVWEDDSLAEWDPNDFRIFCGDLGNEVTEDLLTKVFGRYPSFIKSKVVRDKRTSKSKGYGFVSFKDPNDFVQAMREWNGKYVGNRPIKLRKSTWKDRNIETHRKKQKEKQRLGLR